MPDLPLLAFPNAEAFETRLAEQPKTAAGAWLRFGKPGAPEGTLGKSDAIDCAPAFGWIDGQLGRVDERYYKVRFTPRRNRSAWSQVNRERIERLIADGRMKPEGLAEVTRAKADARWDAAYAPQGCATPDPDLLAALDAQPDARRFIDSLDAANRYAVLYRVHQAKSPDKRAAKIAEMVARLASGEAFQNAPRLAELRCQRSLFGARGGSESHRSIAARRCPQTGDRPNGGSWRNGGRCRV